MPTMLKPPPAFEIGDVVVLNSGGPKMTVAEVSLRQVRAVWVNDDDGLECAWFPTVCVFLQRGQAEAGIA